MLKNIIIYLLVCTFLSAESFEKFLQTAIKNSPYLESSVLSVKQTKEQGNVLTRYENPTLEFEYSSLHPNIGSNDNGYLVNFSQPIRLWSVGNDKRDVVNANIRNANADYTQKRAIFIRDISLAYTSYSKANKLLELSSEELKIAKKIYDISLAQFEEGKISKSLKFQSLIDYEMTKNSKDYLSLDSMESYFSLLKYSGINKEISIDNNYDFTINNDFETIKNPTINVLQSEQSQALAEAKLNSHSVEWINLYAELQNESDQDAFRIGINFPLAIFNDKSQEKSIQTLKVSRSELLIKNEKNHLVMDFKRLKKERLFLTKLIQSHEKILNTQLELLKMYEDGYKISNINLLKLQNINNRVIKTKKSLIQIHTALNQNAIYMNYYKGNYNE
jgi:cobalt-zinc-cadmium efflux system outer membrane protein